MHLLYLPESDCECLLVYFWVDFSVQAHTHELTHTKTRCDTTAVVHAVHGNKNIPDYLKMSNMPGIDLYENILLLYVASEPNLNTKF